MRIPHSIIFFFSASFDPVPTQAADAADDDSGAASDAAAEAAATAALARMGIGGGDESGEAPPKGDSKLKGYVKHTQVFVFALR